MERLFKDLIKKLQIELNPEDFSRWLKPMTFLRGSNKGLSIQVPNIFFKSWIEEKYLSRMHRISAELAGRPITLEFILRPPDDRGIPQELDQDRSIRNYIPIDNNDRPFATNLIERFSFDNFVVGSSNQLAHAASLAVAHRTASYNPLFIYGGSGLGKTHLVNAIGNYVISQDRGLKVVYLSSELFTNELIEAIRSEGTASFRNKYRNIDALLIDDIQFLGGRERTQEEFFYTFNALHEADKQIVMTSDQMPKNIADLEVRLRSRFEGGLFVDITPPDRETKVAILSQKAEEEGITLSTDVAFFLASQNETNIRVLEGYLARLGAYSSLTQKPIDLEAAQKFLGLFMESDKSKISLDIILKVTAEFFNLKVNDIKSSKKHRAFAAPRQVAMYMARQLTGLSTIEIGQRLGNRDHSTVIHAVKKIENRLEQETGFNRTINELKRAIQETKEI